MQIKQFEYLLKIAEEGSITHAAQKSFISQQAISESLKLLEKELGFQIFQRSRKGVTPTETGQEFLNDLQTIMPVIQKWQTYTQTKEQKITIPILVQHVLRSLITDSNLIETLSADTAIAIEWKCLNGFQLIETIETDPNAIGILLIEQEGCAYDHLLALQDSDNYEVTKLTRAPMAVVLHADDPLAQKNELALSDLKNYHFVCHHITKNLHFLKEIIEYVGPRIYQLPETIDIPFFILQHPQTFSLLPAITLKNNIYFKENKLILKSLKQTQSKRLGCFLICNKSAPDLVKTISLYISNYLSQQAIQTIS